MHEEDLDSILKTAETKMKKSLEHLYIEYKAIRTGRANISLLDNVLVDCYGQKMPINQVGTITTPDPHMIVIDPWDKTNIQSIEKAIEIANLGLNPSNDGRIIRVPIPVLTEERRKEIIKMAKNKAEDSKISIRNIRRDANDNVKKLEKDQHISEDEIKIILDEIQELTNKYIKETDSVLEKKEKEILEV